MISYISTPYSYDQLIDIITDKDIIYADSFSLFSCYNIDVNEVNGLIKNGMGIYSLDEMFKNKTNSLPYSENMIFLLSMIEGEEYLEEIFIEFLKRFDKPPRKLKLCCGIKKQSLFSLLCQFENKIKQYFTDMEIIYVHCPFLIYQQLIDKEMIMLKESKHEHLVFGEYLALENILIEEIYPVGRNKTIEKAKQLAKVIDNLDKKGDNAEKYKLVFLDRTADIASVSMHNISPIQRIVDFLPVKDLNGKIIPTNGNNKFIRDFVENQSPQKVFSSICEKIDKTFLKEEEKRKERPSISTLTQLLEKIDPLIKFKNTETFDLLNTLIESHEDTKWEEIMSVEKIMVMSSSSQSNSASQQISQLAKKFSLSQVLLLIITASALFSDKMDLDLIFSKLTESLGTKESNQILSYKIPLIRFIDYIKDSKSNIDVYSSLLNKTSNSATYVPIVERIFLDISNGLKNEHFLSKSSIKLKKSSSLTSYLFSFTGSSKQDSSSNFIFYFDGGFTFSELHSLKTKLTSLKSDSKIIFVSNRFASKKYLLSILEPK
eukprot:TRINITY_DN16721_c0_g1_i1.p1 TRINITY_DN16721_c0_g1~~TRINITY_DN16721_c0_g1_i1.p1  ORF type:complete len:546 (-),score=156.96 TRINITY_DN16721_c0_g1_i1:26-1663(-)